MHVTFSQPSQDAYLTETGIPSPLAGNWRQCLQDALAAIQLDYSFVKGECAYNGSQEQPSQGLQVAKYTEHD